MLRTDARLARLMIVVCLRSAGPAPWLIATGWVVLAVAQEPRMLRWFGIHLSAHAAWAACVALALVLRLSETRPPSRWIPYVVAGQVLTIATSASFALALGAFEVTRAGGYEPEALTLAAVTTAWVAAPLLIAIHLAWSTRRAFPWIFALVTAPLVLSLLTRFHSAGWSSSDLVASIALGVATAALVGAHCRQKL